MILPADMSLPLMMFCPTALRQVLFFMVDNSFSKILFGDIWAVIPRSLEVYPGAALSMKFFPTIRRTNDQLPDEGVQPKTWFSVEMVYKFQINEKKITSTLKSIFYLYCYQKII